MRKRKERKKKPRPLGTGGYPAGDKLVSELTPPPPGPAPGARVPASSPKTADMPAQSW